MLLEAGRQHLARAREKPSPFHLPPSPRTHPQGGGEIDEVHFTEAATEENKEEEPHFLTARHSPVASKSNASASAHLAAAESLRPHQDVEDGSRWWWHLLPPFFLSDCGKTHVTKLTVLIIFNVQWH